jgi:hypothetical protein
MEQDAFGAAAPSSAHGTIVFILWIILLVLGFFAVYLWRRRNYTRRKALLDMGARKITLPKLREEDAQKRDTKELIGLMESVYASIQHVAVTKWWTSYWHGQPTFSFELVTHHGEIFFYFLAPAAYLQQLERQIHAQYPDAHIEPANDYDIFLEEAGESAVAALKLSKSPIFPIRTYTSLEADPLSTLTTILSKVGTGQAAIQLIIQPGPAGWHKEIEEALQNVQQGKAFGDSHASIGKKLGGIAKEVGKSAIGKDESEQQNEANNIAKGNVKLTALQEQQAKLLVEKGSKVVLSTQVRMVARAETLVEAEAQIQTMLSAFSLFNSPESNSFKVAHKGNRTLLRDYIFRSMNRKQQTMLLTTEELTSIYHFPNTFLDIPTLKWLGSRKLAPPNNLPKSGAAIGFTNFRGSDTPIYLQYPDRLKHLYMIGKTGVGKTVLFQNLILQDIRNGHGACYIDPNGDAVEWILRHIPQERVDDVILVDPADIARPLGLNLLEYNQDFPEQKTMVINEMISIFDKLYDLKSTGGPIFEQYMRNAMLLLMDDPASGSTLMEIPRLLADAEFRKYKLSKSKNQIVIDFWTKEAEKAGGEAALVNMVPYITSKLTQFTSNDIMRPMIGQQNSSFDFRKAMDEKKIILVTLPKGLLGEMNAKLLGMIIAGKIQIAAFSRQNVSEEERVPFFLYVDEFQNFTSNTFATILSEARKYRLSLNITHQYIEQLDDDTRSAVMGNVGTMISWRIGVTDAEFLQKEFAPVSVDDLVSSDKFNFYIRMLIDGAPVPPFNAISYAPDVHDSQATLQLVRERSRLVYGRDREGVEESIRQRSRFVLPSA